MRVFTKGKMIGLEREDGSTIHFTEKEAQALCLMIRGESNPLSYRAKTTKSIDDVVVSIDAHHTFVALFLQHGPVETGLALPTQVALKLRDAISTQLAKIVETQSSRKVQ